MVRASSAKASQLVPAHTHRLKNCRRRRRCWAGYVTTAAKVDGGGAARCERVGLQAELEVHRAVCNHTSAVHGVDGGITDSIVVGWKRALPDHGAISAHQWLAGRTVLDTSGVHAHLQRRAVCGEAWWLRDTAAGSGILAAAARLHTCSRRARLRGWSKGVGRVGPARLSANRAHLGCSGVSRRFRCALLAAAVML